MIQSSAKFALFLERLQADAPILTDGSMSTELALRGLSEGPPDVYNLKNPVIVENIHRDFLNAGAELIQTNTLNANRIALERFNLADKVYEINRKGVWIARCAVLHSGFVAGVVGPVGKFLTPIGKVQHSEVRQAFIEQIIALVDGGADALLLKSFIDIVELEIAISAVKDVAPTIPIIAQKTFPEDGSVLATSYPMDIANRLISHGVAAIGANGTVGPQRMLNDIVKSIPVANIPLAFQPDIGIPTLVDGKAMYNVEPTYLAASIRKIAEAGAVIVGADGGASVAHVREISAALKNVTVGSAKFAPKKIKVIEKEVIIEDKTSDFAHKADKKFLTTVELDIPRGLDMSSVIEGAAYLKEHGIDAVNISDGARARLRMSSITISHLVQSATGMECVTHFACRDRNMVGLQSELLGAYSLGVKNILAVTGDPAQIGDYPYATSVYDIDAIGLIRAISRMNEGEDLMGNPIGKRTQFSIACACNPVADDMEREISRLERKVAEGAQFAFSQPIFEPEALNHFLEKIRHLNLKFMLGIIPLRSVRHAEFLHYEVPGMTIPAWARERMRKADTSPEAATQEGIQIAYEFLHSARHLVAGAYFMPAFKKYSIAVEIMKMLGE